LADGAVVARKCVASCANGNCTIPNTATGIATNVTAIRPTENSHLTVYAADVDPRPVTSNVNYTAASPPTSNQVTIALSLAGAISAYNLGGSVDVVIDVVGYYLVQRQLRQHRCLQPHFVADDDRSAGDRRFRHHHGGAHRRW